MNKNVLLVLGFVLGVATVSLAVFAGYMAGRGSVHVGNVVTQEKADDKSVDVATTSVSESVSEKPEDSVAVTPKTSSKPVSLTALPLGDKKYSSSPKKGYIYPCRTPSGQEEGGAGTQGPWINTTNKTWDATKKVTIDGKVSWPNAKWTVNKAGTIRTLSGNGLPVNHTTGVYPVQSTDDAYAYDRNPNSIKEQSTITLSLPTNPTLLSTPECVGGEVGIMLSGVPIFNGFDAGGRDAAAWEVQDSCSGHPEKTGQYHYHSYSNCLKDTSGANEHSDLVGYAFDGFGLYGLKGERGVQLSSDDLDECHGHTHEIEWDGVKKSMYHYHMTWDFPYSVGCMRAKKTVNGPLNGGAESGSGMGTGDQQRPRPSGMGGGQQPPGGMMPPPRN